MEEGKNLKIGTCVVCYGGPETFLGRVVERHCTGNVVVCGVSEGCWQVDPSRLEVHPNCIQVVDSQEFWSDGTGISI